jgi:hypothetical protein
MNTYHLDEDNKRTEFNTIKQITTNNGYTTSVIGQLNKHKTKQTTNDNSKNLWAKFTYVGKQTKFITKLFKDSPIKIAFTTNNSIQRHLSVKPSTFPKTKEYEKVEFTSLLVQIAVRSIRAKQVDRSKNDIRNTLKIINSIEVDLNTLHTSLRTITPSVP